MPIEPLDSYPLYLGDQAGRTVRARKKATATAPASAWSTPVPITAVAGPSTLLTTTDFNQNLFDIDKGTYRQRSPLASFTFETNATTLVAQVLVPLAEAGATPGCWFSVFDSNGAFVTSFAPTSAAAQDVAFSLSGSGVRRYTIVEGAASEKTDTDWSGAFLQSITRTNGSQLNKVSAFKTANRIVVSGDSIANGYVTTNNSRYSFIPRLRTLLGASWQVALSGFAGAHAYARFPTAALQQAEAQRVVDFLKGATGSKLYVDMVGTNAYGYRPVPPAQEANVKASIWDRVRELDPGIRIVQVSPVLRQDANNLNNQQLRLADYASAYAAAAASRPWVQVVDALGWLQLSDLADVVHPNETGHGKIATQLQSLVTKPYVPPVAKTIVARDILGGTSLGEGASGSFPLRVTYSDNSTEQPTNVLYEVSEGNYASGTLTLPTNLGTGDNRPLELRATYLGVTTRRTITILDTTPPTNPTDSFLETDTELDTE